MNSDDDLRHLQPGESPYFLNVRSAVTQKNAGGGSVENTQGNLLINNPLLPDGTNKCIGSELDKENNRILYFIANSNKNHAIFQYNPQQGTIDKILINSILNLSPDNYINHIDFVKDLMYWGGDGINPPRKINLTKANNTNKFLENNVYFSNDQIVHGFDKTLYYTVIIFLPGQSIGLIVQLDNPNASAIEASSGRDGEAIDPDTTLDLSKMFTDLWNNNTQLFALYEASYCNGYVKLTGKVVDQECSIDITATTTISTLTLKVVANNYYPSGINFREDFINRVKYPFECQPEVSVEQDLTKATNLIQNKVFQFRTSIIYDDNEPSALSPISIIPAIPNVCGQDNTQTSYNVIKVNWDVPRFEDVNVLSIVKYVNVYVRNGNLGKFGFVISLTREQFLASNNTFKFYNDGIYPSIDDAFSNKLFDAVPLTNQSQVLADDRIFDGGIVEGYDPICVDDKLTISYEENLKADTFNINGRNFIRNFFGEGFDNMGPAYTQAILSQDNGVSDFGFGGVGPHNTLGTDAIWSDYKTYKQTLPLKGFVFYLLGTNFRAVSVQGNGTSTFSYYPFPTGGSSSDKGKRLIASDAVGGAGGRVYQNFTIKNVPPGKYILRIASHLTTQADLDANNLEWQKSSTNCLAVGGVNGNECLLEVLSDGRIQVGSTIYAKDAFIGDSSVADLTQVSVLNVANIEDSFAISGYLCDHDTTNTGINVLKDTRIELATVSFDHFASGQYNGVPAQYGINMQSGQVHTDHNGYFFFTTRRTSVTHPSTLNINPIAPAQVSTIVLGLSNLSLQKWDGGGTVSVWTGRTSPGTDLGIFQNELATVRANARTQLIGTVTSDGIGVSDIVVATTHGSYVTTDFNGEYALIVYGSSFSDGGGRSDYIVYGLGDGCEGTFTPAIDYYNIAINGTGPFTSSTPSPYSGTYNYVHEVQTVGSVVVIINGSPLPSLKKGGRYRFGKVYYDYANRSTTTLTNDQDNLAIPFPTNPATDGFHQGRALVDWDIYNLPPDWATHYQWVRTLNGNQLKLLQWTAKTVTYIDDSGATVAFDAATQIVISLQNITDYKTIHVDSNVGYSFDDGDRLVLIKNSAGVFFDQYYDFKIKGVKSGALLDIYLDNNISVGPITAGVFFEIYNPTKVATEEIFYEIGECYPIITNENGVKVHGGLTVDQEYWQFDDNFYDVDTAKLGFVSDQPNDFKIGDTIVINQDPGYVFSEYNTTAKVIAITSTSISGFVVVTDQTFLANTAANPGNIVRAAHGRFRTGDTWNRLRNIPITTGNIVPWYVEDYSISDFYISLDQSIGRPNAVNREVGRLFRQSTIRFSNNYIQDTKINGLSSNEGLNEKVLPANYGTIKKMVYTKTTLLAIHENSQIVSMEINKQTIRDTGNQQLIAVANQVLPTDYSYQGSLGTQNPESVVKDDDDNVHGIDINKGIAWTRQVNGIVPISEIKMITYFREKAARLKATGQTIRIPAVYDRGFNQVLFCFNAAGDEPGETIAFTKKDRYWESFYPYVTEYFGKGRNNEVVSFVNGSLWRHNVNPLYNNFYGIQFTEKIRAIGNISGSTMKVWLNTSLEGTPTDKWAAPSITTLEGQQSSLQQSDFELIENVWYSDFLKDSTTPNVANPLIFGDDLRSSALIVDFENESAEYSLLYAINLYAISSEKSNKS